MRLSRDDILKAEDNTAEEVDLSDLPGYNGSVLVRGMTGQERDEFEVSNLEQGRGGRMKANLVNVRAKVVARCVVDDDGQRLFTVADVQALGAKSGAAIDRIYAVAARLSGLSDERLEESARDFSGASGNGSSSSSPPAST